MNKEIIDFARKGNVIRFYLGKNGEQHGDDWNDIPYEHNAGKVYDEFVEDMIDIPIDFDCLVLEPSDGYYNSNYCKDDMKNRKVPCIIIVPYELHKDTWQDSFSYWIGNDNVAKIYFGDDIDEAMLYINIRWCQYNRTNSYQLSMNKEDLTNAVYLLSQFYHDNCDQRPVSNKEHKAVEELLNNIYACIER